MHPSTYQQLASRTECDQEASARRRHFADTESGNANVCTRLHHAVLGLAGEVGELASALEKWIHYNQSFDPVNIKEELGDCMWYIALACNALKLDLGQVMEANIRKLQKRYPEKFQESKAKEENRDRDAERVIVAQRIPPKTHGQCPRCKTPFSDRWPKFCPECGFELHQFDPKTGKTINRTIKE